MKMKSCVAAVGLVGCLALAGRAADDKIDLSGKYAVVAGKKNGMDIDAKAKKATYTVTADAFTVGGGEKKFAFSYRLKPDTNPVQIDMAVAEGPEGTKGTSAVGVVEQKGDTLKLAYSLDKDKRPKDFAGKSGYYIELKKEK